LTDKKLIDDKNIPIKSYNYSAIKDNLERKYGLKISLPTIINRGQPLSIERKIMDTTCQKGKRKFMTAR
jgi:hypothetical protein